MIRTFIISVVAVVSAAYVGWFVDTGIGPIGQGRIASEAAGTDAAAAVSNAASSVAEQGLVPAEMRLPAIDVKAHVRKVGLDSSGRLASPGNFTDVGWYARGTMPGESGTAVFDGHLDNALGMSGVFKRLAELSPGDDIFVYDGHGASLRFAVTRVATFRYDDPSAPAAVFVGNGEPGIALVTCGGKWLRSEQTYEDRHVVYGKLISRSVAQSQNTP